MTQEILTRAKGLFDNISPTGTKYVVEPWPSNNALYRIRSVNKPGFEVLELSGHFTSAARAQSTLTKFLTDRWNESDEVADKNRVKREKIA